MNENFVVFFTTLSDSLTVRERSNFSLRLPFLQNMNQPEKETHTECERGKGKRKEKEVSSRVRLSLTHERNL